MSDDIFRELGLQQCNFMPQLFYGHGTHNRCNVAVKIVNDILITGIPKFVEELLQAFNDRFTLGSIASGPRVLRFYDMNIIQNED